MQLNLKVSFTLPALLLLQPALNAVCGSASYTNQTFTSPLVVVGTLTGDAIKVPSLTVTGNAKLTNSTVGKATVTGPLEAVKTIFTGNLRVTGPATLNDGSAQKLVVTGSAQLQKFTVDRAVITGSLNLDSSTMTGAVKVHGRVSAVNSHFKGTLVVTGQNVVIDLFDCTVQDIVVNIEEDEETVSTFWSAVRAVDGFFRNLFGSQKVAEVPTVKLKGKTIVHGSITFKDGKGVVNILDSARVVGSVIGAATAKV